MFWDTLRADVRHTLRLAIKTPVFSTLTVLALALGIGATTAIFAVVNGVLLRSLPYRDDERLVNIWSFNTKENLPRNPISPANFLDFQKMNRTLHTQGLEVRQRRLSQYCLHPPRKRSFACPHGCRGIV